MPFMTQTTNQPVNETRRVLFIVDEAVVLQGVNATSPVWTRTGGAAATGSGTDTLTVTAPGFIYLKVSSAFESRSNVVGVALPAACLTAPAFWSAISTEERRRILGGIIQEPGVTDASITAAIAEHASAVVGSLLQRAAGTGIDLRGYGAPSRTS